MSTSAAITLIAAGVILRFAVATSAHGLNVHVTGVILILVGVLGLLLSLVRPLRPRQLTGRIRRDDYRRRHADATKRAAAADVAMMQEDDRFFGPDTGGEQESEL